jgi:predicted transcriptional regulator
MVLTRWAATEYTDPYLEDEFGMPSTTVRISAKARDTLRELAARSGEPMQAVLEKAIEHYHRQRFFDELDAAYTALRNDPEAWQAELEERALWETTLQDGLDTNGAREGDESAGNRG